MTTLSRVKSEWVVPERRIIGTAEEGYVYKRQAAHWCFRSCFKNPALVVSSNLSGMFELPNRRKIRGYAWS
jgi:hypothetical protein